MMKSRRYLPIAAIAAVALVAAACSSGGDDAAMVTPTPTPMVVGKVFPTGTTITLPTGSLDDGTYPASEGQSVTVEGVGTFKCNSGPCSVDIANDVITSTGVIEVVSLAADLDPAIVTALAGKAEPKPDPAIAQPDPAIAQRTTIGTAIDAAKAAVALVTDAATDAQVADAETAIAAATAAIAAATNVPADEKTANSATVAAIGTTLSNADTSRMAAQAVAAAAMKKAMAAAGKALHEALGTGASFNPLSDLNAVQLGAAGLSISSDKKDTAGIKLVDDAILTAGDSAGSLGDWDGTHYSKTNTGTKVTNAAVVYTNRAAPTTETFATGAKLNGLSLTDSNYVVATRTLTLGGKAAPKDVAGAMFPTAGTQTFTVDPVTQVAVIPGTYQGASGSYACTAAANVSCDAEWSSSGISLKKGTWRFVHDVSAMVSNKDPDYLYFGWWLNTDKDGVPVAASAFHGVNPAAGSTAIKAAGTKINGSATYVGNAAGKFSINDPLSGGDAGDFTADATLTAKFGDAPVTGVGISGTLDNFMANDNAVPWSVSLKSAPWTADGDGAFESAAKKTVWSIDGKSAAASGDWKGQMYDEAPKAAANNDGSDIPTSVTGVFQSQFGSTHSMVGAFGATK